MSKKKKIIISVVITMVVLGAITGVLMYLKHRTKSKKSVDVYPVSELATSADMYEYTNYSFGIVNSGMEQKIYLMSSQKIDEIKVTEGQHVKAGDVILVYDTTSQELALDLMQADVEIARAAVVVAEKQLEKLKNITPVESLPVPPEPADTATSSDAPTATDAPKQDIDETDAEDIYTKEELDKAIKEKEAEIRTLTIAYQLVQIDLQIMEQQNSGGEVVANFDGVVKSVIDEDEALLNAQPLIVISGENGYTIEADIEELSLGAVAIGDVVDMFCYENGMSYTGQITDISDTPTYSYGIESYYTMTISIDNADELVSGMGMDITLPSKTTDDGAFYLQLAYVAKEDGRYYVLKETDGVLEKVYVKTGKILWGDNIKIYGGITMDDYIAFPYSKDAVEGAGTKQASAYDMYY